MAPQTENYTDRELEETPEFLEVEVDQPEDALNAQVYVMENPGTMIALDYNTSFVQRGATERKHDENLGAHTRIPGGATTYPDENTYELILSDGCFQDFREHMFEEVKETRSEAILGNKDIFLETDQQMEEFPKLVGFAARVGSKDPNLYGASWREDGPTEETLENIESDITSATPEQYEESFETAEMWDRLTKDAVPADPDELVSELETEPEDYGTEATHDPESCMVNYSMTDGKPAVNWPPGNL